MRPHARRWIGSISSATGGYRVTPLKQDPKDFSRSEMRREMALCRSLEPLYRTAMALLPELGISNDRIAYYAALVDYYTVQKLQQLTQSMAHLYLLCFLLQHYQRIYDDLVNALIYHVRKVLSAKVCLQERLLSDLMEGSKNVQHIGPHDPITPFAQIFWVEEGHRQLHPRASAMQKPTLGVGFRGSLA